MTSLIPSATLTLGVAAATAGSWALACAVIPLDDAGGSRLSRVVKSLALCVVGVATTTRPKPTLVAMFFRTRKTLRTIGQDPNHLAQYTLSLGLPPRLPPWLPFPPLLALPARGRARLRF